MAEAAADKGRARGRVLVVEDRDSLRRLLERALTAEGYRVASAADGARGIRLLEENAYDLVLTDVKLPEASGLEVLAASRRAQPQTPVVLVTAYATVGKAVEAMKQGAFDFLEKPVEIDDLLALVASAVGDKSRPGRMVFEVPGAPAIVGAHPRLKAALRLLKRVAPTESTVLVTGESGTGKELFARALHALSPRASAPFVAVNCAAIPEALMENELFGHERGAFTGADRRQPGRFELAEGGTLLLDEVGELALGVQAKVLRVLEEKTFERVGGGSTLQADVRLVAATNRPLAAMVAGGDLRSDLYFRLNVFPIEVPPLRQRASDIPLLARHLLERIAQRQKTEPRRLTPEAEALLGAHPWPGNVRELGNVLERATILAETPRLDRGELEALLSSAAGLRGARAESSQEVESLRRALAATGGDKALAAEQLGVSYSTLQRRIRRHDLEGFPRYRS